MHEGLSCVYTLAASKQKTISLCSSFEHTTQPATAGTSSIRPHMKHTAHLTPHLKLSYTARGKAGAEQHDSTPDFRLLRC